MLLKLLLNIRTFIKPCLFPMNFRHDIFQVATFIHDKHMYTIYKVLHHSAELECRGAVAPSIYWTSTWRCASTRKIVCGKTTVGGVVGESNQGISWGLALGTHLSLHITARRINYGLIDAISWRLATFSSLIILSYYL